MQERVGSKNNGRPATAHQEKIRRQMMSDEIKYNNGPKSFSFQEFYGHVFPLVSIAKALGRLARCAGLGHLAAKELAYLTRKWEEELGESPPRNHLYEGEIELLKQFAKEQVVDERDLASIGYMLTYIADEVSKSWVFWFIKQQDLQNEFALFNSLVDELITVTKEFEKAYKGESSQEKPDEQKEPVGIKN